MWYDSSRRVHDPRALAWVEVADMTEIDPLPSGGDPDPSETVTITRYEPTRVELRVNMIRPGIVVLADVFYPGWRLAIDGTPAPILRVNRMMRGAAVPSGDAYAQSTLMNRPRFVSGPSLSVLGLVALAALGLWTWKQDRDESSPVDLP